MFAAILLMAVAGAAISDQFTGRFSLSAGENLRIHAHVRRHLRRRGFIVSLCRLFYRQAWTIAPDFR